MNVFGHAAIFGIIASSLSTLSLLPQIINLVKEKIGRHLFGNGCLAFNWICLRKIETSERSATAKTVLTNFDSQHGVANHVLHFLN